MFEIYNEKIQDLLSGSKQELQVREDPKTGPVSNTNNELEKESDVVK